MEGTDKKQKNITTKKYKSDISKIYESNSKKKNGKIIIELISAENLLPLDE